MVSNASRAPAERWLSRATPTPRVLLRSVRRALVIVGGSRAAAKPRPRSLPYALGADAYGRLMPHLGTAPAADVGRDSSPVRTRVRRGSAKVRQCSHVPKARRCATRLECPVADCVWGDCNTRYGQRHSARWRGRRSPGGRSSRRLGFFSRMVIPVAVRSDTQGRRAAKGSKPLDTAGVDRPNGWAETDLGQSLITL
jgi:hypothetical protein